MQLKRFLQLKRKDEIYKGVLSMTCLELYIVQHRETQL
jgi:hypothetical protein